WIHEYVKPFFKDSFFFGFIVLLKMTLTMLFWCLPRLVIHDSTGRTVWGGTISSFRIYRHTYTPSRNFKSLNFITMTRFHEVCPNFFSSGNLSDFFHLSIIIIAKPYTGHKTGTKANHPTVCIGCP